MAHDGRLSCENNALDGLRRFIGMEEFHLGRLIDQYADHNHLDRPHQGLGNGLIDLPGPKHRVPSDGSIDLATYSGRITELRPELSLWIGRASRTLADSFKRSV